MSKCFFSIKILKQLECCLVYFSNSSQTPLYNELHCHSYQLLLWKNVFKKKTAFQTYRWVLSPGLSRQPPNVRGQL